MANNFGALANSTLVHDLMDDLVEDLRPFLGLALNLGEETADGGVIRRARPGTTITVTNWSKPFTPYTVGAGGYIAPDYTALSPVTVTVPSAVTAVSMALTGAEYRVLTGGPREGVAYDRLREKVNEMMFHGLKLKMATDFLSLITAANYPNETEIASAAFTRSSELDIEAELFQRKIASFSNPKAIVSVPTYKSWAADHIGVHTNTGARQSNRVMSGGKQGSMTEIEFWRSHLAMPADAPNGFAFTKTAAVLINRIPDEPTFDGDPVSLAEVIDPETGLAFLSRLHKNTTTGQIQFDIATIYTFAVLQGTALERITEPE